MSSMELLSALKASACAVSPFGFGQYQSVLTLPSSEQLSFCASCGATSTKAAAVIAMYFSPCGEVALLLAVFRKDPKSRCPSYCQQATTEFLKFITRECKQILVELLIVIVPLYFYFLVLFYRVSLII